jgi:hypothetical protein
MNQSEFQKLDDIISNWPGVNRREAEQQTVFSVAGKSFCWLSPASLMIQISPCLGRGCGTRRLEHVGNVARLIRQRTNLVDAQYDDPKSLLTPKFSYPGLDGRKVNLSEAESLIRQAFERLRPGPKVLGATDRVAAFETRLPVEPISKEHIITETRTVTIESPFGNMFSVQVEASLVDKFIRAATDKNGPYRSKESSQNALESAFAIAMSKFLEGLNWPE